MANNIDLNVLINAKDKASGVLAKFGGVAQKAGQVAAIGVTAVAGASAAFSVASIKAASDAEEMEAKFNTVFKDLAGDVSNQLGEFANEVNRSKGQLMGFASGLQDTFVPLGFARKEASEMSVELVKLATDLGSFNNVAEEDVVRDLQSAMVGNTETLRKYGIVANQSAIEQYALNNNIWDGVDAISAQEKASAIMGLTVAGSADAMGDASRTSDSFANQMRGLKASFDEVKVAVGKELLPVITPLVGAFANMITNVGPTLIPIVKNIAGGFMAIYGAVQLLVTGNFNEKIAEALGVSEDSPLVTKILELRAKGVEFFDKIRSKINEFANTVRGVMLTAWERLKPSFEELKEVGLELFETLKYAIVDNEGAIHNVKTAIKTFAMLALEGIKAVVEGVIIFIKWLNNNKEMLRDLVRVASSVFAFIAGMIGAIIALLGNIIKLIAKIIVWFHKASTSVRSAVGKIADKIRTSIETRLNNVKSIIQSIINKFNELAKKSKININLPGADQRATGGPVQPNKSYLVGERGPEIFTPNSSGQIMRNDQISMGASGGGKLEVTVNGDIFGVDDLAEKVVDSLSRQATSRAMNINQYLSKK